MNEPITMHAARMALNHNEEIRTWAETWLKAKEQARQSTLTEEEFEKHWRYVRPERMHEGAIEAVLAYRQRNQP
jgi:hypothetical protein